MAYKRKTKDEWILQVLYVPEIGWEDECCEDSKATAKLRLTEYQANCQYAVRIVKRRVRIETEDRRS